MGANKLSLIVGHRAIGEAIELRKLRDIVPDCLIIGMENMSAVLMNVNTLNVLGIDIASDVWTLVDNQNGITMRFCLMSKTAPYGPEPTTK